MPSLYRFGAFTVDLARGCVLRGGEELALRPKSLAVLQYLVVHAGRLVTKEELLASIWPGVVVTEDSLTRCVSEVRALLGDDGAAWIKTLPRRGYRFDAAVRPLDPQDGISSNSGPDATPPSVAEPSTAINVSPRTGSTPWRKRAAALALVGLAAISTAIAWSISPYESAARLTLVVLPFDAQGSDANRGYLADNLTEELAMALSRLRGATVIAAASAFTYRNRPIDLKQLGAELGVRYVVQGSVAGVEDRLHINTRLLDARSGRLIWSDQVDVPTAALRQTQDRIVLRVATALDAELVQADSQRSARAAPTRLDAEDLAMQCDAAARHQQGESGAPSYVLCERALQLDPNNVRALVRLAAYYGELVERNQSPDPAVDLARARAWVGRALDLAPYDYAAHCAHAVILGDEHRMSDAIAAAQRCLALNPSHAKVYQILAAQHFFRAEPEKTLKWVERGMHLSPKDPEMAAFMLFRGWAHLMRKEDDQALTWLRNADAAAPGTPSIMAPLVSVLALTGHDEEARATLSRYLESKRTQAKTIAQWQRNSDPNPAFEQFAERFKSGLRKAGMAEG